MKKNTLFLFALVLTLLFACSESDLGKKKSELKKLEGKISALKEEAAALKKEIFELDPSSAPEKAELITFINVEPTKFRKYIEAQGTTYSDQNINVTSDMGGLVTKINVEIGQFVQKGKLMVELDNQVISQQLQEVQTNLKLAKDVFEKRQRLWEQNIGSEIEYLQAKNNYESLMASEKTLKTQMSKTSVKAPISGYIEAINVRLGEMVSPGTPAVQVVNLLNMEVRAELAETHLKAIKKADEIDIEIPVLGLTKKAKITSVGKTVSQNNRTFRVIAQVNNSDSKIKPNLLAKIKIKEIEIDSAITIPARLLQESSNGYFVFTASEDDEGNYRAIRNKIKIGAAYDGQIVVLEGLEKGAKLIDMGYRSVLENQLLEVKENSEF